MKSIRREWTSEKVAAEMVGLAPITFRRAVKEGRIPVDYTKVLGKSYLYSKVDIDQYLEENSVKKTA